MLTFPSLLDRLGSWKDGGSLSGWRILGDHGRFLDGDAFWEVNFGVGGVSMATFTILDPLWVWTGSLKDASLCSGSSLSQLSHSMKRLQQGHNILSVFKIPLDWVGTDMCDTCVWDTLHIACAACMQSVGFMPFSPEVNPLDSRTFPITIVVLIHLNHLDFSLIYI